ncbi:MAG: toll/interleukin-1 receptor domain-containing protein [candidate division KSB1 bacterium]|nr:toll/interleukin-1 receptor domain-containing protein [candidate division KSB1 bacterium]MDZ7366987.1 toll/interleukin-1 receptor domain-containing protein [candidate division KSB1 bacterium]MDZ7406808.1 toll/interleukin-1 receptor domain-containing protein [candidate division KSB1 bacterium]
MNTIKQKQRQQQRKLRVFLSYAAADGAYAHQLHHILSQRLNLQIFTDRALSAGEDWKSKLKAELAQCDIFVVLLSPNSVQSAWVLQELGAAWMLEKPILPVVTHPQVLNKIPVELSNVHLIEVKDLEYPEIINKIFDSVEAQATNGSFV